MIIGAHSILYSKMAGVDRDFLRDVLGFPSVDAGDGWLIFGLPMSVGKKAATKKSAARGTPAVRPRKKTAARRR